MKHVEYAWVFMVFTLFLLPARASSGEGRLQTTGRVALSNYYTGEYAEITYREGGRTLPAALKQISQFMRSRDDGSTHPIDLRLVTLLDHLQHHFGAETIEIISGYRSPAFNQSLRENGHAVARESLHMKGMAADIHLDDVDEETLFEYLTGLGIGGVGLYPRYLFVHADVGPPRAWREPPAPARELVGTQNNPNPAWTAVTDQNVYRPGDRVTVAVTNNDYGAQRFATNVWYERFRKGQWSDHELIEKESRSTKLKQGESTPYAWQLPPDQPLGKYRLVFFASKDLSLPPVSSNEFYVRRAGPRP